MNFDGSLCENLPTRRIHNSPYSLMRYFFRQPKYVVVESSSYFARWISFCYELGPGYKIIEVPVNLVYLPITLFTISAMETKLTDQNGKLLNPRGEELSIRFQIREV